MSLWQAWFMVDFLPAVALDLLAMATLVGLCTLLAHLIIKPTEEGKHGEKNTKKRRTPPSGAKGQANTGPWRRQSPRAKDPLA